MQRKYYSFLFFYIKCQIIVIFLQKSHETFHWFFETVQKQGLAFRKNVSFKWLKKYICCYKWNELIFSYVVGIRLIDDYMMLVPKIFVLLWLKWYMYVFQKNFNDLAFYIKKQKNKIFALHINLIQPICHDISKNEHVSSTGTYVNL